MSVLYGCCRFATKLLLPSSEGWSIVVPIVSWRMADTITELVGMDNKRRVVGPFHLPKVTLLAHVNIFWIIRIGIGEYFEYRRL